MLRQIFFQSSLPRAGSTLLQNILGQNPEFYSTPTSPVLDLILSARKIYSNSPEFKAQDKELMKKGFLNFCNEGLNGFYEGITDKPYILDKNRGWGIHYGFLNSFYPNPKIICMVRDPKDVFTSMEKKFRKNPHIDTNEVNYYERVATTTSKRIDFWANGPLIGSAFERLHQTIHEGNDRKMLFVKFEDLTSSPEVEMRRIYNYLGVPFYDKHDFNNVEQVTHENDSFHPIYGDHKIKSKIQTVLSQADQILGEKVIRDIQSHYKWFYNYFGYSE